ncbi:MAG: DegQ family serine endoprotease [Candidatus Hydrogenedentes bacterium]|nr:DegQ family serine endoprotease [Candidatus Hydrogenedentota bacterium]
MIKHVQQQRLSTRVAAGGLLFTLMAAAYLQPRPVSAQEVSAPVAALQNLSDAFAELSGAASPAVVYVEVEKRRGNMDMRFHQRGGGGMSPEDFFRDFFDQQQRGRQPQQPNADELIPMGQGSGFLIREDGYIVTNNHVVSEADRIKVRTVDGKEYTATVVGSDPKTEVAVVKIEGDHTFPFLPLGDSDKLRVGEWVLAIGNPFGLSHTVTAGIVSARGRSEVDITDYSDFIQTDAAINPGNSGGPLLNVHGEVVGLNTAIFSRSGGNVGVGFAVPINMVKFISNQLIENGSIQRGFLGVHIQDVDSGIAKHFQLADPSGAIVADVQPDSPSAQAGLQRDDIITEVNGEKVKDASSLRSRIASTQPGTAIDLTILRDGESQKKSVTLAVLDEENMVSAANPAAPRTRIGLELQDLTPDLAKEFEYGDATGVLITGVVPGSSAEQKGLQEGDLIIEVNRQPVSNVGEVQKQLDDETDDTVMLRVRRGELSRLVVLNKTN